MAESAIVALFTAEAVTAATVLSAVAEVGFVMSAVGVVTGNKDLMAMGGVIGAIGGIGGLVNGALSGATAAAGLEGVASSNADIVGSGWGAAADAADDAVLQSMGGGAAAPEGIVSSAVTSPIAPQGAGMATSGLPQVTSSGDLAVDQLLGNDGLGGSAVTDIATPGAPASPATNGVSGPATPFNGDATRLNKTGDGTQTTNANSFFGGLKESWKNMGDISRSQLIKGVMSIPGGIQQQTNADRAYGLQRDQFDFQQQQYRNLSTQNRTNSGIISRARTAS